MCRMDTVVEPLIDRIQSLTRDNANLSRDNTLLRAALEKRFAGGVAEAGRILEEEEMDPLELGDPAIFYEGEV